MMCRRLKHCTFSKTSGSKLVSCVLERLRDGRFAEQFKDQLRLALLLDRQYTVRQCESALQSNLLHVQRYSAWVLTLDERHTLNAAQPLGQADTQRQAAPAARRPW
jgi:hypothetical protein